jgi:hypothetical protein
MKGIEYILPTLYFLRNLQIGLISKSVFPNKPFRTIVKNHSNLLQTFVSYEEI